MTYTVHGWRDGRGRTVIDSVKLGEIDQGILYAHNRLLEGHGSPVNVLTPLYPGVRYVDLDQTGGDVVWVSTGTTSASWAVAYGTNAFPNKVGTSVKVAGHPLTADVAVAAGDLTATGTKSSTTLLRGDNVWAAGVNASTLGTSDLDAVTAPGTYIQTSSANGTLANHYPMDGWGGWVTVYGGEGNVMQEAVAIFTGTGSAGTKNNRWYRTYANAAWGPWMQTPIAGIPGGASLIGTGSPVGVITPSAAGIRYFDTAGTIGAWEWVSTGTTNTSWRVTRGDTGWRNLDLNTYANMANGIATTGTNLFWRLTQDCVRFSYQVATGASWPTGYQWIAWLPEVGGAPVMPYPSQGYASQAWYYGADTINSVSRQTVRMNLSANNPGARTGETTYAPSPGITWPTAYPAGTAV